MKGVVFDEFISMVEQRFSPEMADRIIGVSHLATGGAYTSVGTYDHRELLELIGHLSEETGQPVAGLLRAFGSYLFRRFAVLYPGYLAEHGTTFTLLASLDNKIHVEVKKLYPDAELPRFHHSTLASGVMELTYRSQRPFADLAEGLILGSIDHFHERIALAREDLPCESGAHTRFVLTREPHGGGY